MSHAPALAVQAARECWNEIGIAGDRSCPELVQFVHCHNCPVFATAGQRLLDGAPPSGYLDEVRDRLAAPPDIVEHDEHSALVFRIGEEWLALPVQLVVEVQGLLPVHRVPHRAGLLAGMVNIRGELELCVRLGQLLSIDSAAGSEQEPKTPALQQAGEDNSTARMLVAQLDGQRWVFPVDEVDQVRRFAASELTEVPATVSRYSGRLSRGVFTWQGRTIGYLDGERLGPMLTQRVVP